MNLTVQTTTERLAALAQPSLDAVSHLPLASSDWLFVCAGFEDRALEGLRRAISNRTHFNVLIILYAPFLPQNKADALRELCSVSAISYVEATYDRQNPSAFGRILLEVLASQPGRVFVDVSAMSRLLIVQTIVA